MKLRKVSYAVCVLAALALVSCGSTKNVEDTTAVQDSTTATEETSAETEANNEQKVDSSIESENAKSFARVEKARQAAIDAKVQDSYPDGFNEAEKIYNELKKSVDADKKTDRTSECNDLINRYNSLVLAAQAKAYKAQVDEMAFNELDKKAYEAGANALKQYDDLGSGASGADLLAQAKIANESYKALLNKGLIAMAGRERKDALDAKKKADSVKAGVAKKDIYTEAANTFKKGDSDYVTGNTLDAYNKYKASKETFNELYETIYAKRAEAQAKIDAAKKKVAESAEYATEADSIAPVADGTAGIEKEDAVLLEEDKLANPEEAVIDVEEGKTADTAEKTAEAAIAVEGVVNKTVDSAVKGAK